jgi:predicted RNase H-like HicB family nuclease
VAIVFPLPKNGNEMEKVKITVGWDRNYSAFLKVGDGMVIATGDTLEKIKKEFAAALEFHLKGMQEDGDTIPDEFRERYELEFHLNTQALLRYTEGIVSRKALSQITGINQQQLTHYASGWRNPRPEMQQRIIAGVHELGHQLIAVS